jgi:hypothetical protein
MKGHSIETSTVDRVTCFYLVTKSVEPKRTRKHGRPGSTSLEQLGDISSPFPRQSRAATREPIAQRKIIPR